MDLDRRVEVVTEERRPPGYSPRAFEERSFHEADTGSAKSLFEAPIREIKYGYSGDTRPHAEWPPVAVTKAMEADSREVNLGKRMTAVELHELYGSLREDRGRV